MTRQELADTLALLFPHREWPKPLHVLRGLRLVASGASPSEAARTVGTTARRLGKARQATDPVEDLLGVPLHDIDTQTRQRSTQMLGQLLLGRCAELAFERIYKRELRTEEFQLRDLREGRTDTDYRVLNGRGRPVYRVNIKFYGSLLRQAPQLVGLEPDDCFALATYKIHSALQKQHEDGLPYFYAIVGVPQLTGESVGRSIPSALVETVALVHQAPRATAKRQFEDAAIDHLVQQGHAVFTQTLELVLEADWYILSARRADKLLRELLFQRVFALRVRNFTRAYRRAEVDMHFSLAADLIPLREFLATLRDHGPQKITTLLERGDY